MAEAALCVNIPDLLATMAVAAAVAGTALHNFLKIQLSFCVCIDMHSDDFIHVEVNTHHAKLRYII